VSSIIAQVEGHIAQVTPVIAQVRGSVAQVTLVIAQVEARIAHVERVITRTDLKWISRSSERQCTSEDRQCMSLLK